MAIDNIAQTSRAYSPAATAAAAPAAPGRQDLPGTGLALPPAAASADVKQAVSRLNDYVQNLRRDVQFRVDKDSNRVIVSVVNSESGEVIRQIPSEEVLAVARSLDQLQQGLLFRDKA